MRNPVALLAFLPLFAVACGGSSKPAKAPPEPSAAPAAEATPADSDEPADDGPPGVDPAVIAKREKQAAAVLKHVKVTQNAALSSAPAKGVYAMIYGHATRLDKVSIDYDGREKKWTLQAKTDDDAGLGPAIDFTNAQARSKRFGKTLKQKGSGFFQVSQDPKAAMLAHKFDKSTSLNAPFAYHVKLTKWKPGKGKPGKCSGKLTVFLKTDDGPVWATGTFKNAECSR